jgi:hypothetical protein
MAKLSKLLAVHGVKEELSGLRDRGPGSRPLTFTKEVTNFRILHVVGFSCTITNSVKFCHAKDVKTLELRVMN